MRQDHLMGDSPPFLVNATNIFASLTAYVGVLLCQIDQLSIKMKKLLQTLCFIIIGGCSLEGSPTPTYGEMHHYDVSAPLRKGASVSVCVHDDKDVLIFQKVEKGYWFKGGYINGKYAHKHGDAKIIGEYSVYPQGLPAPTNKYPGQWVLSMGGVQEGESLKATAFREFQEETGCHISAEEGKAGVELTGYSFRDSDERAYKRWGPAYVLFVKMPTAACLDILMAGVTANLDAKATTREGLGALCKEVCTPAPAAAAASSSFTPPVDDDELVSVNKLSFSDAYNDIREEKSKVCHRSLLIVQHLRDKDAATAGARASGAVASTSAAAAASGAGE